MTYPPAQRARRRSPCGPQRARFDVSMDDASHSPGTDLVPLTGAHVIPRRLARAADVALGAGARATGLALALAGSGRGALRAGLGIAASLPGSGLARDAVAAATRPLAADGARVREQSVAQAQRTLERAVPAIVALIDVDAVVQRIDLDAVVATIDIDALLSHTDVDAVLRRVDLQAALDRVDLDELVARIDVDAIAARVDVNAIVQRVDVDAVVEQTELGTIVARSTSGFASEALDVARAQTVGVDTLVTRIVDRLLRRRAEGPLGPALLVDEPDAAAPVEEPAPPGKPPP